MKLRLLAQQDFSAMTPAEAISLRKGQIVRHLVWTYKDGVTPMKFKVTGKVKQWKTRPGEFRIPVKAGLNFHTTINNNNLNDFYIDERDRRP